MTVRDDAPDAARASSEIGRSRRPEAAGAPEPQEAAKDATDAEASPDEGELVRASRDGQPQRFRELVERYQRPVFAICLRMVGQWADAEDLAQQAFLQAFAKLDTFDDQRAFGPWLFRIALNGCKDFLKSRKRSERPEVTDVAPEEALFGSQAENPEEARLRRERLERLSRALLELPLKYRTVLILKDIYDFAYKDIQQILELPVTTLKIRVVRGRRKLAALWPRESEDDDRLETTEEEEDAP